VRCPKKGTQIARRGQNKEDTAVHSNKEAQQQAVSQFWALIGVAPQEVPPGFRKLCEELWRTMDGCSLPDFMGKCMDGWEALGNKQQPRPFAKAKAELIKGGREQDQTATPINFLPERPFRKRSWTMENVCPKP